MTMARKTITIPTGKGPIEVCATMCGALAVHCAIGDSGINWGWRCTHVGTGCAIPGYFRTQTAALAAAAELDQTVEWDGFIRALHADEQPAECVKIIQICKAHGAVFGEAQTSDAVRVGNEAIAAYVGALK
jgi:hypothetical protein